MQHGYHAQATLPQDTLDDSEVFKTNRNTDRHTIVDMNLRSVRFLVLTAIALVAAFTYATVTNTKMVLKTIDKDGKDIDVFLQEVDAEVSAYNALFGTIMFAGSKIFEVYTETFIFPTLHTYLHNCSLYPGDQPQRVYSKVKSNAIFWGLKTVVILMNVGFASLYVGRTSMQSESRRLSALEMDSLLRSSSWESPPSTDVHNTILRTAVTGSTTPFDFVDTCHAAGVDDAEKSSLRVQDVDTTSVLFGFPSHDWSASVLPHGAAPTMSIQVHFDEFEHHALKYEQELESSEYDVSVAKELFVQGAAVLRNSLGQHSPLKSETSGSLASLMDFVAKGMNSTLPIDVNDMEVGFETFDLAEDITFVSLTIDVPVRSEARSPSSATVCGARACVFSHAMDDRLKPEISIMPYTKGCTTLPHCDAEANAAFLYGVGRSVKVNSKDRVNPMQYLSLSFGKIMWRESLLHVHHRAECVEGHCLGLSVPLSSMDGVVLVSSEGIPSDHLFATHADPLHLVTLNPVIFPANSDYSSTWDRITNGGRLVNSSQVEQSETTTNGGCSALVDSYVSHLESNHFYLETPLQAMYTSALLYLVQNGVPTRYADATSRRLALAADEKQVEIVIAIPESSSIATFVGCVVMLVLTLFAIYFPTERVKLSPNTTAAARYVQILTDDLYPDIVHKKRLRFVNGDCLLFNEYVVDSIVLHAKRNEKKKIYL